jgi:MFS transporter, AAHS family, 4-hydroxybenzoate transporter
MNPTAPPFNLSRAGWLVCFYIAMIDGYDTLMLSFIAPLIARDWHASAIVFGRIFAATYAGAAVGATTLGAAADRYGRKRLLLLSLAIAGTFNAVSALARTPDELMLLRALCGIGLGGAIPIISALAAAGVTSARRRAAVTRVFIGYPIGAMLGGVATAAIMGSAGWRSALIGSALLTLLGIPLVLRCVTEQAIDVAPGEIGLSAGRPLTELFTHGRALRTLTVCAASFLILLVSYFLVSWMPTVLVQSGMSTRRAALVAVLLNFGGLIGGWGLATLAGSRRPSQAVAICLMGGSLAIVGFGLGLGRSDALSWLLVLSTGVLIIGAQINIPALCASLYPVRVCASGVGLAMTVGRVGSIAGPLLGGYLLSAHMSWPTLFLLAAIPALLAGASLATLNPTPAAHLI